MFDDDDALVSVAVKLAAAKGTAEHVLPYILGRKLSNKSVSFHLPRHPLDFGSSNLQWINNNSVWKVCMVIM